MSAVVPKHPGTTALPAAVTDPADASARGVVVSAACGLRRLRPRGELTVRRLILRNAWQDVALARSFGAAHQDDVVFRLIRQLCGDADVETWCRSPRFPEGLGAEWYLRLRDSLYRMVN